MMKRMNELEEKVTILSKRPSTMPPDKEEMLSNALKRIDMLEQELSNTRKVTKTKLILHILTKAFKIQSRISHNLRIPADSGGCSG